MLIASTAINLPINFALFEYLSDSANLDTIIFARPEEKNSALLAENVVHGGRKLQDLELTMRKRAPRNGGD